MQDVKLIVMLTHNDRTVENAFALFEECKDTGVTMWGLKEKGLPLEETKRLFAYMKEQGKTTVLEVVAYTEEEGLRGAQLAADCGCDILAGTLYFPSIAAFCRQTGLKYMPFVGEVSCRPSVLEGSVEAIVTEAQTCVQNGVYGIDLLGYRYTGDAVALNRAVVSQVAAPVCIAGSVNSYARLEEVKAAAPWAFTVGGAFFENAFGGSFREQVEKVYEYIKERYD